MSAVLLSVVEARVIAALAEKSITTPQYYPMTVNGIMLAANQKSSRHPVMNLTEGETGAALNQLEQKKLCQRDDIGSRVPKWRQQLQHQLLLKPPAFAVLLSLMLRGPQTLGELRSNSAPLGGPPDVEGVSAALASLNDRAEPLAVLLPRAAGQKEARFAHCLSGAPDSAPFDSAPLREASVQRSEAGSHRESLEQRIEALERRLAALEQALGS